jgi:hypothetical protein
MPLGPHPPGPLRLGPECETIQTAAVERSTARIVSWLTPNSAASARRLFVVPRARIDASRSGVSLRARAPYRGGEDDSRREGQRRATAGSARRSGNGMRQVPIVIEDAEPIPVASASSISRLTPSIPSGVFPFLPPSRSNRSRKNGAKSSSPPLRAKHFLHDALIVLVRTGQAEIRRAKFVGVSLRSHEPPFGRSARYTAHAPAPLRDGRHPPRPVETARGVAF